MLGAGGGGVTGWWLVRAAPPWRRCLACWKGPRCQDSGMGRGRAGALCVGKPGRQATSGRERRQDAECRRRRALRLDLGRRVRRRRGCNELEAQGEKDVVCFAALQGGLEYMMITRDQTTTNHSTKRSPHPQLRRTLATRRRRRRHWGTYSQMLFTVHAHATQLHI